MLATGFEPGSRPLAKSSYVVIKEQDPIWCFVEMSCPMPACFQPGLHEHHCISGYPGSVDVGNRLKQNPQIYDCGMYVEAVTSMRYQEGFSIQESKQHAVV